MGGRDAAAEEEEEEVSGSSYAPQTEMYWWLTTTGEVVNEDEWMGGRNKKSSSQSGDRSSREGLSAGAWTQQEHSRLLRLCVENPDPAGEPVCRPLPRLCSGLQLLVGASVLMRAKAKGATQRNVHTETDCHQLLTDCVQRTGRCLTDCFSNPKHTQSSHTLDQLGVCEDLLILSDHTQQSSENLIKLCIIKNRRQNE